MPNLRDQIIALGKQMSEEQDAAYNLWTWLPSHQVTEKHHGDYVDTFCPSVKDVMVEAAMYLGHIKYRATGTLSDAEVDKICFNIGNTHDQSELWSHMRKDPEVFRQAVRLALGAKESKYTQEEKEWFERCTCGEDHLE